MKSVKLPETRINARNSGFKISKIAQNIDKTDNAVDFAVISNFQIAF